MQGSSHRLVSIGGRRKRQFDIDNKDIAARVKWWDDQVLCGDGESSVTG